MRKINVNSKSSQITILIFLGAFWGGALGVFSKKALMQIPPTTFAFLRVCVAGVVLLPWFLRGKVDFKKFKSAIPVSLLLTINIAFFAFGVHRTSATIAQMLYTVSTLLVAVIAYVLLKEKLNAQKWIAILIGLAGALVIVLLPALEGKTSLHGSLAGNLIVMLAVLSFSFYAVLSKKLLKSCSPLELTSFFILTSIVVLALLAPFDFSQHPGWWRSVGWAQVLEVLYVGAIGTVAYYFILQKLIKLGGPIIASTVAYLQAVFTALWAALLLDERITLSFLVASVLVFAGVALTTSRDRLEA